MVSNELLVKVEAFIGFDEAQLAKIKPHCEELTFRFGDRIFTEGEPAEHLWTVVDGQVDLRFELPDKRASSNEFTVSSLEVEEKDPETKTMGWSCFVPPYKMRLSAYVMTNRCKIIRVAKSDLLSLFDEDPLMGYRFLTYLIKVVGFRFHQFQDEVAKNMGQAILHGW